MFDWEGATCRTPEFPDTLWLEPKSPKRARQAAALCELHCPKLEQCRTFSIRLRPYGIVQAGHYWPELLNTTRPLPGWWPKT